MGSKMAVGDDFEQLADLVPKHKRHQSTFNVTFDQRTKIVKYLNDHDQGEKVARDICIDLWCKCAHDDGGSCVCKCN